MKKNSPKLIVANWKSNPATLAEAVLLAKKVEQGLSKLKKSEVVIAPPYSFLASLAEVLSKVKLGAQNAFWQDVGPYTGEISWHQLKNLGVKYVIIGHSERKIYLAETDEMINKKLKAVLKAGFESILCVGERARSTDNQIPVVVEEQLKKALAGVRKNLVQKLSVAYEPIWAISTMPGSRPDTPDNAFRASVFIRKVLAGLYGRKAAEEIKVIYGGSVNSKNIFAFLQEGKMEGALVGGASLDPEEFITIVKIASRC